MSIKYEEGFYPQNLGIVKLTDEELEAAVANQDYELVYRAVSPMLKTLAGQYYRYYNLFMEYEDVYQISMIGLWLAMKNYKPEEGSKFTTYAHAGMSRMINRYKKQLSRKKRMPPKALISIDAAIDENDDGSENMFNFLYLYENEIESKILSKESLEEIEEEISKVKSDSQREILTLAFVEQYEQPYIVKKIGKSRQYINFVINKFIKKLNKRDYLYTD